MDITQIHARLAGRFGEAIGPLQSADAGDPWIAVQAGAFLAVCTFLRDEADLKFDSLRLLSGVDWTDRIASVYHLYSYPLGHEAVLHVDLDRADPRVASVAAIWPTAEWHEREAYDLLGIVYEGHPALTRIFMPDDWVGYPLRKDYQSPKEYHGIPNE